MTSRKPRSKKKSAAKKAKTAANKKPSKRIGVKKAASGQAKPRTAKKTAAPSASRKVAGAASLTDLLLNANSLHLEIVDAVPELGIRAAGATRAAPKCKYKMERIPHSTEVNLYRWSEDIQDFDFVGRMPRERAVAIIRACVEG